MAGQYEMGNHAEGAQGLALNGGRVLHIEEGRDYFVDGDDQLPYKLLDNLGHGHSANVEMVQDKRTGSVFARKVFRICNSRDERKHIFENEIKCIRRLAPHHHVIRVFATYVAKREVGLILSPVADGGDLESFLQDFKDKTTPSRMERQVLLSSFGCLASGLYFMHSQKIRHKDIKPRNILIHQGSVIYTDFGYSLDHGLATGSTTTGRPHTLTRKYCAPEVSDWEPRNSKSDIFSLGCVYLEIYAAVQGTPNLLPGTASPYHEIIEYIGPMLRLPPFQHREELLVKLIRQMLLRTPSERPSAQRITRIIWAEGKDMLCAPCLAGLRSDALATGSLTPPPHDLFAPEQLDPTWKRLVDPLPDQRSEKMPPSADCFDSTPFLVSDEGSAQTFFTSWEVPKPDDTVGASEPGSDEKLNQVTHTDHPNSAQRLIFALEVIYSFCRQRHEHFVLEPLEYFTVGKVIEKLKINRNHESGTVDKGYLPDEGMHRMGQSSDASEPDTVSALEQVLAFYHQQPEDFIAEPQELVVFSKMLEKLKSKHSSHNMHGHGSRPHLCYFADCERSMPGHGYPCRYNLFDHMKRVHDFSSSSTEPPTSPSLSAPTRSHPISRKRKSTTEDAV